MKKKTMVLLLLCAFLMLALLPSAHVFAQNNISGLDYVTGFSLYVNGEEVQNNQTIDYYSDIKLEYNLEFQDALVINNGDTLTLPIPKELIQKSSLQFPIKGPNGIEIGKAVAKEGEIKIIFNDYFESHPENKFMNVELWSEWDYDNVGNGDWVDIIISNFKIHVQAGNGIVGGPVDHEKWGVFNEANTEIEWTIKLNEKLDAWKNVILKDFIGPDQELIEDSIGGLILESFDDYTNHESVTSDMIQVNSDKSGFEINLGDKLNQHGLLLTYRVRVKNLEEGKIYTNGYELSINGRVENGEAEKQYLSGGGTGGGTDHAEAILKAKKTLEGRELLEDEFEFILEELDSSNVATEKQRKKNSADGNIVFDKIEYRVEGTYNYQIREIKGDLEHVTYDEKIVKVQVKVELRADKWYIDIVYADNHEIPTFENRYDSKIDISVTKVWIDNNNQDGIRPQSIQVQLVADHEDVAGRVVELNQGNGWHATFDNLPEYKAGQKIIYSVREVGVPVGYNVLIQQLNELTFEIKNTHTPQVIEISGQKHWEDNNNQDGVRPTEITVILKADDVVKEEKVVTATDNWSYTFSNLPKYRDQGVAIVYTVEEKPVDDYQTGYNPDNYNIVNVHTPEVIEISGQKHWEDENNQDGVRPNEITVILKADGVVKEEKVVKATDNWSYAFSNLPKYRDQGVLVVYTVEEKPVDDYQTGYNPNNYDIVNVHTPEVIEISGQKHWEDANNQDGVRPTEIIVVLKANGEVVAEKVVKAEDGWKYSFENLPKFKAGKEIVYTIEEKPVDDYQTGYNPNNYDIVNVHTPEVIEISGQKHWEDADNQDGVRPTEIIVILKADDVVKEEKVVKATDNWSYTFSNLPKYRDQGVVIVYTIEEKPVDDYQTGYNPNNYDIVNVHTPEVIEISGQKHWEDANNQDGVRPTEIIVILKANGEVVAEKVVKAEDGWKYTFENLPKFKAGKEIVYTIEEKAVDGYTSVIKAGQFDITNTHKPEMIEIGVEKVWQDEQNQDGSRPQTITVVLLANGEKVAGKTIELSASVNWKGVFENLPKYKDGQVIKYSVEEVNVPKGYKAVVTENGTYQFIITNSHTPELPNTGMSHGAEVGLLALGCLLVGVVLIRKRKSN